MCMAWLFNEVHSLRGIGRTVAHRPLAAHPSAAPGLVGWTAVGVASDHTQDASTASAVLASVRAAAGTHEIGGNSGKGEPWSLGQCLCRRGWRTGRC